MKKEIERIESTFKNIDEVKRILEGDLLEKFNKEFLKGATILKENSAIRFKENIQDHNESEWDRIEIEEKKLFDKELLDLSLRVLDRLRPK